MVIDLYTCTQCETEIRYDPAQPPRHAIPCGHVFCHACVSRVTDDSKTQARCAVASCKVALVASVPMDAWPLAMCTARKARLAKALQDRLSDQGDAGDGFARVGSVAEDHASPATNLCEKHGSPVSMVCLASLRGLCQRCLSDSGDAAGDGSASCTSAGRASVKPIDEAGTELRAAIDAAAGEAKAAVAELEGTGISPETFPAAVAAWAAQETARIRAWEAERVKDVTDVASELVLLVEAAAARRTTAGAALLAQRLSLAATLQELQEAVDAGWHLQRAGQGGFGGGGGSGGAAVDSLWALREQRKLTRLLLPRPRAADGCRGDEGPDSAGCGGRSGGAGRIVLPSSGKCRSWAVLPTLAEFLEEATKTCVPPGLTPGVNAARNELLRVRAEPPQRGFTLVSAVVRFFMCASLLPAFCEPLPLSLASSPLPIAHYLAHFPRTMPRCYARWIRQPARSAFSWPSGRTDSRPGSSTEG